MIFIWLLVSIFFSLVEDFFKLKRKDIIFNGMSIDIFEYY